MNYREFVKSRMAGKKFGSPQEVRDEMRKIAGEWRSTKSSNSGKDTGEGFIAITHDKRIREPKVKRGKKSGDLTLIPNVEVKGKGLTVKDKSTPLHVWRIIMNDPDRALMERFVKEHKKHIKSVSQEQLQAQNPELAPLGQTSAYVNQF